MLERRGLRPNPVAPLGRAQGGQSRERAITGRLKGGGLQGAASGRDGAAYCGGPAEISDGRERDAFLREAEHADRAVSTLCMTLAYAGCRLYEALALTVAWIGLTLAPACSSSGASRSVARASAAACRSPLPCRTCSTWRMACVRSRRPAATVYVSVSGLGAGRPAGGPCTKSWRLRGSRDRTLRPRDCGTASGWRLSPRAFPLTSSRSGTVLLNSPQRRSTLTLWAPRRTASPSGCGASRSPRNMPSCLDKV